MGIWKLQSQSHDVPDWGPRAEAGPGGDETEDARGCDLFHTELSHLRGPAASHSIYLKEIGQHMKTGHLMNARYEEPGYSFDSSLQVNRPRKV